MANELEIFKSDVPAYITEKGGMSPLMESVGRKSNMRRIAINNSRTFKRIVGGEQIGKPVKDAFNAIIVAFLPSISRTYYEAAYDPDAKPTLPDCWSNLGIRPEENVPNAQSTTCAKCENDVDGSGPRGRGRACRFNRRIALIIDGDTSGDIYQLNIPATSLFGDGDGEYLPFEKYLNTMKANKCSVDYLVTNISYDEDSETAKLFFRPVRYLTKEEHALVVTAQEDPETQKYIELTVAETDGVTAKPKAEKEQEPEPVKTEKSAGNSAFFDEEDTETAPVKAPRKRAAKKTEPKLDDKDLQDKLAQWAAEADAEEAEMQDE